MNRFAGVNEKRGHYRDAAIDATAENIIQENP
jgi:hypothetical protein